MWNSRDVKMQYGAGSAVSLLLCGICFYFDIRAGMVCLFLGVFLLFLNGYFMKRRYQDIADLSGVVRNAASGEYLLDLQDHEEGELSILHSEIVKVIQMLKEQGSLYQDDQKRLAEAIADISHQLKTPVTSMTVMADLLAEENLDVEKRRAFTRQIQLQLQRMDWLLSTLLKLSKIDAGTAVFQKEPVSASKLLEKALVPVAIPMEVKNQKITISGGEETTFFLDVNWTAEALINILKNCVEHTPEGGNISIACGSNPLYKSMTITDDGPGISREDLPYIFKRFYRGRNAGPDSVGIGLAMAKSIIKSQNGDLTAESEEGCGTQFHLKFYENERD